MFDHSQLTRALIGITPLLSVTVEGQTYFRRPDGAWVWRTADAPSLGTNKLTPRGSTLAKRLEAHVS